jgi:hypothetical protein
LHSLHLFILAVTGDFFTWYGIVIHEWMRHLVCCHGSLFPLADLAYLN